MWGNRALPWQRRVSHRVSQASPLHLNSNLEDGRGDTKDAVSCGANENQRLCAASGGRSSNSQRATNWTAVHSAVAAPHPIYTPWLHQ